MNRSMYAFRFGARYWFLIRFTWTFSRQARKPVLSFESPSCWISFTSSPWPCASARNRSVFVGANRDPRAKFLARDFVLDLKILHGTTHFLVRGGRQEEENSPIEAQHADPVRNK